MIRHSTTVVNPISTQGIIILDNDRLYLDKDPTITCKICN